MRQEGKSEAGLVAGRVWPRWLATVGHDPESHKQRGQESLFSTGDLLGEFPAKCQCVFSLCSPKK